MTEFEKAVLAEVRRVRELLQQNDSIHQFTFTITASGRVHSGDVNITFAVGEYSGSVIANSVDGAVYEHLRRNGWERANTPLMISGTNEIVEPQSPDVPY